MLPVSRRAARLRWLFLTLAGAVLALAVTGALSLPVALTGEEPLVAALPALWARVDTAERPVRAADEALAAAAARGETRDLLAGGADLADCSASTSEATGTGAAGGRCVAAAGDLAAYARALDGLWSALPPYRAALGEVDTAEMARTRLLGGRAESLRSATWPIVEHLKLYPDAERDYGAALRADPPARLADQLAARAAGASATGAAPAPPAPADLNVMLEALRRVRAGVLRYAELDARYAETLREYDAALARIEAAPSERAPWPAPAGWVVYALALCLAVGGALAAWSSVGGALSAWPSRVGLPPVSAGHSAARTGATLIALAAALFGYYLAPSLPLAALAALAFLALAWRRLDLAVALVPATIPFHFHPRPVGGLYFSLTESLVVACTGVWLLRGLWRAWRPATGISAHDPPSEAGVTAARTPLARVGCALRASWRRLRASPFFWPALLFLAAGTLSLLTARGEHLREAVRAYRLTVLEPVVLGALFVACLRPGTALVAVVAGLTVAALVGAHAVGQYVLGQGVAPMEGVDRVSSLYPSATALALYLGRAVPFALALGLAGRAFAALPGAAPGVSSGRAASAGDAKAQPGGWPVAGGGLPFWLLLLPIAGGLLVTWTRGAWLGVWVAGLVMLLVRGQRRAALGWVGLAAVAVAVLAGSRVERLATLFSLSEGTNVSRLLIWTAALGALRDHPLLGIGLDQFLYLDRARYGVPDVRFLLLSHPHNVVLDFWLSLGLAGLAAGIWLAASLIRHAYRLARSNGDGGASAWSAALALGALGGTVEALVHGLVDLAYFVPDLAVWWWVTIGLVEVLRRDAAGARPAPAAAAGARTERAAPAPTSV